jgi:hypothetical protein
VVERMITIAQEISRQLIPGECIAKLLDGPGGRGMFRDRHMHHAPAIMGEEHQDEEQSTSHRRDDEEISRDQLLPVIGQERAPCLRWRWLRVGHVLCDSRLGNGEAQLQQLTVNSRCTPERVRNWHRPNQRADLSSDGRTPQPVAALPRPKEAESVPMPGDDGFGLHDNERRPPLAPDSGKPDPEQPVDARQPQPTRMRSVKHAELVPVCEDFELQGRGRAQSRSVITREIKTAIAQKATHRRP